MIAIYRKKYFLEYKDKKAQKLRHWVWLIVYFIICSCNGFFLKVSTDNLLLAIYFAIFPLTYILLSKISNTWVLKLFFLAPWTIVAFVIGNSFLPSFSATTIIIYSINVLLFALVLMDSVSDNGLFMLLFVGVMILLFLTISDWEKILRLIWYCNFMTSANNSGTRLNKYLRSFLSAMTILTITSALGLTLGWMFGSRL